MNIHIGWFKTWRRKLPKLELWQAKSWTRLPRGDSDGETVNPASCQGCHGETYGTSLVKYLDMVFFNVFHVLCHIYDRLWLFVYRRVYIPYLPMIHRIAIYSFFFKWTHLGIWSGVKNQGCHAAWKGSTAWWFGTVFYFPLSIDWEFHHPNWRTHIFQRGRSTTNQK